jgi:hypothetical protein
LYTLVYSIIIRIDVRHVIQVHLSVFLKYGEHVTNPTKNDPEYLQSFFLGNQYRACRDAPAQIEYPCPGFVY